MHKIVLIPFFTLLFSFTGCSVFMAASGDPEPDLSRIVVGADRAQVEREFGAPTELISHPNGSRELYEFTLGDASNPERAWANAGLNIATAGLWELYAVPGEFKRGVLQKLVVEYNSHDIVVGISPAP